MLCRVSGEHRTSVVAAIRAGPCEMIGSRSRPLAAASVNTARKLIPWHRVNVDPRAGGEGQPPIDARAYRNLNLAVAIGIGGAEAEAALWGLLSGERLFTKATIALSMTFVRLVLQPSPTNHAGLVALAMVTK